VAVVVRNGFSRHNGDWKIWTSPVRLAMMLIEAVDFVSVDMKHFPH
jgi:hypothetical protein